MEENSRGILANNGQEEKKMTREEFEASFKKLFSGLKDAIVGTTGYVNVPPQGKQEELEKSITDAAKFMGKFVYENRKEIVALKETIAKQGEMIKELEKGQIISGNSKTDFPHFG